MPVLLLLLVLIAYIAPIKGRLSHQEPVTGTPGCLSCESATTTSCTFPELLRSLLIQHCRMESNFSPDNCCGALSYPTQWQEALACTCDGGIQGLEAHVDWPTVISLCGCAGDDGGDGGISSSAEISVLASTDGDIDTEDRSTSSLVPEHIFNSVIFDTP